MHAKTEAGRRSPNVGFLVGLLWCLAVWAGLAYLIGLVLE
jgi:hypothetical protein